MEEIKQSPINNDPARHVWPLGKALILVQSLGNLRATKSKTSSRCAHWTACLNPYIFSPFIARSCTVLYIRISYKFIHICRIVDRFEPLVTQYIHIHDDWQEKWKFQRTFWPCLSALLLLPCLLESLLEVGAKKLIPLHCLNDLSNLKVAVVVVVVGPDRVAWVVDALWMTIVITRTTPTTHQPSTKSPASKKIPLGMSMDACETNQCKPTEWAPLHSLCFDRDRAPRTGRSHIRIALNNDSQKRLHPSLLPIG